MKYPRPLCNPFIVCEHAWEALNKSKCGNIIECGVFDGCTSAALNFALRQHPKFGKQIACDTFEGMPYDGTKQERAAKFVKGHLAPACKENTIRELERLGIEVLVGRVEDTIPQYFEKHCEKIEFGFAFLDLDLEIPTRFCVEELKDRIVKGGRIGFHDYDENPKYALHGICLIVKQYFSKNKAWREVTRDKKRDGRFMFLEKL